MTLILSRIAVRIAKFWTLSNSDLRNLRKNNLFATTLKIGV